MSKNKIVHPGEQVKKMLLDSRNLTINDAAKLLYVNRSTLSRLVNGHIGISPEMALRLSKLLPKTTITVWLNLQQKYDIAMLESKNLKLKIKPLGSK